MKLPILSELPGLPVCENGCTLIFTCTNNECTCSQVLANEIEVASAENTIIEILFFSLQNEPQTRKAHNCTASQGLGFKKLKISTFVVSYRKFFTQPFKQPSLFLYQLLMRT